MHTGFGRDSVRRDGNLMSRGSSVPPAFWSELTLPAFGPRRLGNLSVPVHATTSRHCASAVELCCSTQTWQPLPGVRPSLSWPWSSQRWPSRLLIGTEYQSLIGLGCRLCVDNPHLGCQVCAHDRVARLPGLRRAVPSVA